MSGSTSLLQIGKGLKENQRFLHKLEEPSWKYIKIN